MDLQSTVEGFFHDEVDRAFRDTGLRAGTMVEHYVVQLLAAYAAQGIPDAPLALKLAATVDAAPRERRRGLREIGDTSLYVSGFWADSLADKLVDVGYYIEMGGSAYGELARGGTGWTGDPFGDVFGELAANFVRFVEVLALVSRRTARPATNEDVMRLYRSWQRTGSRAAAAQLASLGVVPPRSGDGRPQ
ncbi:MAG TPA: hypothetical protein VHJ20_19475 [Polyangia bacterium]|nr:hypothetical protein [Polyangia bacterium]